MKHILFLVPIALLAGCGGPGIEATPEYGYMSLSGDFAIASGSISGTTSMDEIGLGDEEGAPGARVDLEWGSPHLSVTYSQMSTSGSGTTSVDLSQGAVTIPAGSAVDSDLDLAYGNALITFDLVPGDNIEAGIGLGIEAASVDASVVQSGGAARVDTDGTIPIPVLALRGGFAFGPFSIDGTGAWGRVDYSGDSLEFLDIDLRARWMLFDHAHILLGYKHVDVDLDYEDGSDDVLVDVTADGPYLGVVIAF